MDDIEKQNAEKERWRIDRSGANRWDIRLTGGNGHMWLNQEPKYTDGLTLQNFTKNDSTQLTREQIFYFPEALIELLQQEGKEKLYTYPTNDSVAYLLRLLGVPAENFEERVKKNPGPVAVTLDQLRTILRFKPKT